MGLEIIVAVLKSCMKNLLHAASSLKMGGSTIAETSVIICQAAIHMSEDSKGCISFSRNL